MGSIRNLSAIAAMAVTSGAMAETPHDTELRACLTAAYTKHIQAKNALFSSVGIGAGTGGIPQLTIDFYMSQRRLDETYCSEYARCVVAFTKPATELAGVVAGTQFSGCLAEEAKEGADADDKK
jgi:hypothetical protein